MDGPKLFPHFQPILTPFRPLPLKILGLDEKESAYTTYSGWNHQKGMKFVDENFHFHSKFLSLDENDRHTQPTRDEIIKRDEILGWNFPLPLQISGSGWKLINRHNQLWMKSSKEMKILDENFHFHSKFWVWMKNNQRKQTNSGWNYQKRWKFCGWKCATHGWRKKQEKQANFDINNPYVTSTYFYVM